MNELITINYQTDRPTVSGRDLHEQLGINTRYTEWFKRMCEYGFHEDIDYKAVSQKWETAQGNTTTSTDHQLTIPMAKELCMLQRSEKGKMFRRYFIQVEEEWNSPEMVMKRALQFANQRVEALRRENSQLTVSNEIMRPKAEFFDDLVDRNMLTSIRDTAKELRVKERAFVNFLIEKGYLYRDQKGKLTPKAGKGDGYFEVKESKNEKTKWAGQQTMVTPRGREALRLLTEGLRYD